MSKTLVWFSIASIDFVIGIILRSIVMRQFDEALAITPVVGVGDSFGRVVAHEVKIELGFGLFNLPNHFHAEVLIEFDYRGAR
jgi:hypothetical protein